MRVISGTLKGRRIPFNNGKFGNARVTSERMKGALFSLLGESLESMSFLDVCSCSGQIGLEAYSRGAEVVMNEPEIRRNRFISNLMSSWNIEDRVSLFALKADRLIQQFNTDGTKFDLIYIDPPYTELTDQVPMALHLVDKISKFGSLNEIGTVVVQHDNRLEFPARINALACLKQKKYGNNCLTLYGIASP